MLVQKATPSVTHRTPQVHVAKNDNNNVVRFQTFPSKTAWRLMATMASAMDHPCALLTKRGGLVGLLDIPPDELLDGTLETGSSVGSVDCQVVRHGNMLRRDISGVDSSDGVAAGVVLQISLAVVADGGPTEAHGDSKKEKSGNPSIAGMIHLRVRWPSCFQSVCQSRTSRNLNAFCIS
ncbi:hypothetical protein MHU86_16858 [Fragilaria crotonensis]|nr:hypothetical protein MHU86_16858 [Fragilaria crotonensis]